MNNQDDHYFTRMSEVRQEIEEHVFPVIIKYLEEALNDLRDLKGDILSADKLALVLTKMDNRIKELEGRQVDEKEK